MLAMYESGGRGVGGGVTGEKNAKPAPAVCDCMFKICKCETSGYILGDDSILTFVSLMTAGIWKETLGQFLVVCCDKTR